MEYKKFEYPSFNLYTVKTNRFKTCQMEVIFKSKADPKDVMLKTFLADLMSDCSKKYKTRKDVARTLEELYQASFYGLTNKTGNILLTSFVLNFLNPKYVKEENYLEQVLELPLEMIFHPAIEAGDFDIKNFNIVKNRLHDEILSVGENINRVSLKKALEQLDSKSPTSYGILGTIKDLEDISPKKLALAYQDLMNSCCDIFLIGDLDMDQASNIIFKHFKNSVVKTEELPSFYVENPALKKEKKVKEKSQFLETSLVQIYSLDHLTEKEKVTTVYFYNYLLGGGGLNTKLYQLLREKNSLCYGVKSMYLKYDNLLVVQTSVSKNDVNKAKRLIKQAFREMKLGQFSMEELNYAKESFVFSLNLSLDNPAGILNNYVFHIYDKLPLIEDRIKMIDEITKEEIVAVANKIKPNISFILEGEENNGDN